MTGKGWAAGALTALLVLSAWVIGSAKAQSGGAQSAATNAPPPASKTAEQQFKNIQVLKGIPAEQLIPAMQFITASLGVECDFCHVQGAFEKDDKRPKETARKMMQMMFAINKDNFNGHRAVTCYSCHRESAEPVGTPLVASDEPKPAAGEANKSEGSEKQATSGLPPDDLFDKYLRALGGAGAVDKITSRVQKGTIEVGGIALPIEIFSKNPEKRVSVMHTPDGDSVTAFAGHEGWLGGPGHPVREMHGPDLDGAAMDADLHLATHLKQMFTEIREGSPEKVEGRDAYLIVGRREGKPPVRLYFDEQSGLLVRLVRYGETPLGRLPTQIDYADYREANGVKIPFRWTLARPGGRFTIRVNEVQQNVPVDDTKFAKPAEAATERKGPAK